MKRTLLVVMAAMMSSFASASLTDGLVGYWPFDGNANDYSGNNNHGNTHGVSLTSDRYGNSSSAYYFGGRYDNGFKNEGYIVVPNSSSLHAIGHSFTISAWIRIDAWCLPDGVGYDTDNSLWASVVCKGYYNRQYSLQIQSNRSRNWYVGTESALERVSVVPSLHSWHHVAISDDGKKLTAYVDGVVAASSGVGGAISKNSEALYIGMDKPGALEYFNGAMDDLFIYNRALSSSEIKALMRFSLASLEIKTIIFNSNGGSGAMEDDVFEEGKEQMLSKNTYTKDGYEFQGWAETKADADSGIVKYRDEELITVDHDMTLYAVWAPLPPPTLAAESANWSSGSITLRCEDADTSGRTHTYTLQYYDESTGTWKDVSSVQSASATASLTDTDFSSRLGGIPPVKYRVTNETSRVSAECVTRNRHAILIALDKWGYNDRLKPVGAVEDLRCFRNLALDKGGFGNVLCCFDEDANHEKVGEAFRLVADDSAAGDICILYIGTHGGRVNNEQDGVLCLYDGDYHQTELAAHIRILNAEANGLAVVGIVSACHSRAMFEHLGESDEVTKWYLENDLAYCSANLAWITAASEATSSTGYFDEFFLRYGWDKGYAGKTNFLTLRQLAEYAKRQYDALYSGVVFEGDSESYMVQISENLPLLDKITIGKRGVDSAEGVSAPAPFSVTASRGVYRDKIDLSWDEEAGVDDYVVFYKWGGWIKYVDLYDGPWHSFYIAKNDKTYNLFLLCSKQSPMSFVIKAINGAGVTSSGEINGWLDNKRTIIFNARGGTPTMWLGNLPVDGEVRGVVELGSTLETLPIALRDGFSFVRWRREIRGVIEVPAVNTIVTDDVTYYAEWTDMTTDYLNQHPTIAAVANGDIATAAAMTAANGCRTVGECYALGIDPEDPNDDLKITDFKMEDGKPIITLNHTKDGSGNSFLPHVKTVGKADISDATEEWREVPEDGDPSMRFFKVQVEMP